MKIRKQIVRAMIFMSLVSMLFTSAITAEESYYTSRRQINLDGDAAIGKLARMGLAVVDIRNGFILCLDVDSYKGDEYMVMALSGLDPFIKITYNKKLAKDLKNIVISAEARDKYTISFRITGFNESNPVGDMVSISVPKEREAKLSLVSITIAEIAYFAEMNKWGNTFNEIGWAYPDGNNTYAYFLNSCDQVIPALNGFKECPEPLKKFFENHQYNENNNFFAGAVMKQEDGTYNIWVVDKGKYPQRIESFKTCGE